MFWPAAAWRRHYYTCDVATKLGGLTQLQLLDAALVSLFSLSLTLSATIPSAPGGLSKEISRRTIGLRVLRR